MSRERDVLMRAAAERDAELAELRGVQNELVEAFKWGGGGIYL
jgi:hypothetical protein